MSESATKNNKIVLITGASRGPGRGIARQFGRLGATVYVTSRASSEEELQKAAAQITAAGGTGVAIAVDHRDAEQVESLVQRIREVSGRLDILVNNATAVHQKLARPGTFWEKPLALGDMIEVGLRSSYLMSYFAAPLMVAQRRGLIANISFYGAMTYFHGPAYGAAKAGTDKMSFDMAIDLRKHNVACVSLWPGFIYSDALAQFVGSAPKEMIPAQLAKHLPDFERPEFSALILNALYEDPQLLSYSGETLIGAELGERYGIRDVDGKQPPSYRSTMGAPRKFVMPSVEQPMSDAPSTAAKPAAAPVPQVAAGTRSSMALANFRRGCCRSCRPRCATIRRLGRRLGGSPSPPLPPPRWTRSPATATIRASCRKSRWRSMSGSRMRTRSIGWRASLRAAAIAFAGCAAH